MSNEKPQIDQEALELLAQRLRRGIPKWEQADFIELVVPMLVARLQDYLRLEPHSG